MISTVIIDANKQDRDKISAILAASDDIKVLAQGNDGYDALRLIGSLKPDIVVLNNHLELIEEEDIAPLLRVRSPSTAVVILTARISDYQLFRAASNEVSGFVHKETDLDSLPGILGYVSRGECFISQALAARFLHLFSRMRMADNKHTRTSRPVSKKNDTPGMWHGNSDPIENLSKMELRILTCIGEGYTSCEIAENLGLAVGTVRNYISTVMHKIGLQNRSQMVRYACHYGLVPR